MNTLFEYENDIAIIIVTFNSATLIDSCLRHLFSAVQTLTTEIYLVDNHSEDHTAELLDRQSYFPHAHVILNSDNLGFTAAVNQGLSRCSARHILILNPDVLVRADTIHILLDILDSSESIGLVAPQFRFFDGRIQPSCRRFPRRRDVLWTTSGLSALFPSCPAATYWKMPEFDHRSSRFVDQPQGAFLLFKDTVRQQIGILDPRFFMFFSDVDYCLRIIRAGWKIRFCTETFCLHSKGHSIHQKRAQMIVSSHRSFYHYFQKHQHSVSEYFGTMIVHFVLLIITLPRVLVSLWFMGAGNRKGVSSGHQLRN